MRYTLIFYAPEPGANGGEQPSAEAIAEMQRLMTEYADALDAAGALVAAEMFAPSASAVTVTRKSAETVTENAAFAVGSEPLAGVVVIDVPNDEAALAWAERFPGTNYGTVEVRAAGVSYVDGRWQLPG